MYAAKVFMPGEHRLCWFGAHLLCPAEYRRMVAVLAWLTRLDDGSVCRHGSVAIVLPTHMSCLQWGSGHCTMLWALYQLAFCCARKESDAGSSNLHTHPAHACICAFWIPLQSDFLANLAGVFLTCICCSPCMLRVDGRCLLGYALLACILHSAS